MRHISKVLKDMADPGSFDAQYRSKEWKQRTKDCIRTYGCCRSCKRTNVMLHTHHVNYTKGVPLWEAKDEDLVVLCESCHKLITEAIREFRRAASFANAGTIASICLALQLMLQKHGESGTLRRLIKADEFYEP
jgi:hypothetical protein